MSILHYLRNQEFGDSKSQDVLMLRQAHNMVISVFQGMSMISGMEKKNGVSCLSSLLGGGNSGMGINGKDLRNKVDQSSQSSWATGFAAVLLDDSSKFLMGWISQAIYGSSRNRCIFFELLKEAVR